MLPMQARTTRWTPMRTQLLACGRDPLVDEVSSRDSNRLGRLSLAPQRDNWIHAGCAKRRQEARQERDCHQEGRYRGKRHRIEWTDLVEETPRQRRTSGGERETNRDA